MLSQNKTVTKYIYNWPASENTPRLHYKDNPAHVTYAFYLRDIWNAQIYSTEKMQNF
jgi:hypothetical protein